MNEQLKALDIPGALSRAQAAIDAQKASGTNSTNATKTVDPSLAAFYSSNGTTLPGTGATTATSSTEMFYQMLQLMQMMMSQAFSNMSNSNSNTASTSSIAGSTTSRGSTTGSTSDTTTDSTPSSASTTTDDTSQLDSLTSSLLEKTLNQVNGTGVDVNKTLDYVKKMTKMSQNLFQ